MTQKVVSNNKVHMRVGVLLCGWRRHEEEEEEEEDEEECGEKESIREMRLSKALNNASIQILFFPTMDHPSCYMQAYAAGRASKGYYMQVLVKLSHTNLNLLIDPAGITTTKMWMGLVFLAHISLSLSHTHIHSHALHFFNLCIPKGAEQKN